MSTSRPQSAREERVNATIHAIGAVAGLIGLFLAGHYAWTVSLGPAATLGAYTLSVTVLFGVSAAYHLAPAGRLKRALQRADHCAIYGLIAGTYTPLSLLGLGGTWGWSLFAAVWALAAVGITMELVVEERNEAVSLALYLVMGWLALVAAVPLVQALPLLVLALILVGGLLYTGGTWFYTRDDPWDHALWHGFVLGGAAAHGVAVVLTV